MQLHGACFELADGVSQESIGIGLLLRRGYIVFRLFGFMESCVSEGDALLQRGALHDVCHGPKQGVVPHLVDGLQHVPAYALRLLERHFLVAEVEEEVPEHYLVPDDGARHVGYLGEAVVVTVIDVHLVAEGIDGRAPSGMVVHPEIQPSHLSVEAQQLAFPVIDIERPLEDNVAVTGRLRRDVNLAYLRAVFFFECGTRDVVELSPPAQHDVGRNDGEVPLVVVSENRSETEEDVQVGASQALEVGTVEHTWLLQHSAIAAVEGHVAQLDARLGTQESLRQFVGPGVLRGEAEEVVAHRFLVLLGLLLHLAHQAVQEVVRSHHGQLAQCGGDGFHKDGVGELRCLMADALIADARDAEHVGGKALERELAVVVADGAARGRDIDAGIRHRFARRGIHDDSGQSVL